MKNIHVLGIIVIAALLTGRLLRWEAGAIVLVVGMGWLYNHMSK